MVWLTELRTSHAHFISVYFEAKIMLRLAILFLILGLVAAVLGFGGIAGASFAIAKTLVWVFLAIFLIFLVLGLVAARRVT
ncbi:MAG TPA: DUF1328 domain-containing protein [Rhizomicrobium sp.]|jgi:uncharacterized membrane protein YtjA (UPF0391 family)